MENESDGDRKPAAPPLDYRQARVAGSAIVQTARCQMPPAERRCSASLYIGKSASKPIGNDWPTCNFCPEFSCSDTEQSDTSGISRDITV